MFSSQLKKILAYGEFGSGRILIVKLLYSSTYLIIGVGLIPSGFDYYGSICCNMKNARTQH